MTCEDCIHYSVCYDVIKSSIRLPFDDTMPADNFCLTFINKSDYVKVVRCKDCKYWNEREMECKNDYVATDNEGGASFSLNFYLDDFCSYGERREQ